MADNIRIIGNILNTSTVERYSGRDVNLISSKKRQDLFGGKNDYIEYFIYDAGGNLLNTNYNYLDYKLPSTFPLSPAVSIIPNTTDQIQTTDVGIVSTLASTTSSLFPIIEINPIQDIQDLGYLSGEFKVRYNLFEKKISDPISQSLFIKEISRDRTEIRLGSTVLSDEQIESGSLELIDKISNTEEYYVDYLLNFDNNEQYVAVNVALNKDPEGYEILFKLYEPLPLEIQEKQTLWVVEEKVAPYVFDINLDRLLLLPPPPTLRGPNFDIEIEGQGTISTAYNNYSNLISGLQTLQSSSYSQIQSLLTSQSININVDYSNFNNFVFFGSAYQRVNNFYNKVKEIETLQNEINTLGPTASTTASLQTTLNKYSASINNIIAEFDGFEYYLYFNSSSLTSSVNYGVTPYPKLSPSLPYALYPATSDSASVWYEYATDSALEYDADNKDNLEYTVPSFIKDNTDNQPFLLFLNMVGHYFDNIWIYLKSTTDINLANNNLDYGISRDLVYQQLKSLGIKLYNSQAGDSVDNYLIGANTGSVVWDNDFSITGSYLNNIPRKDLVAELYKRIYHNLPLLAKTKGTVAGLNNLMTTFGVPNRTYYTVGSESFYTPTGSAATASILNVKEFGGSLKSELVSGYNNDKVRIVSNNIAGGNILSPLMSLQEYPIVPSEFRDDDLHYVDISFSPQTQIDTYISGAITSNNPTWSLDDYIGDPGQLYSGSYPDLDTQRTLYFETGVPGFNPFTASLLDYNGFIRLIEFFDNSLFKMLNDFVPERTSLSTGVTFNSPVLERNKVAYSKPTAVNQDIYGGTCSDVGGVPLPQYGTFYDALSLSNNTKAWYDGDISGSIVDINQYFEDNFNPYLQPTASLTPTDINFFNHSDWNVLLNNVSKSLVSNIRQRIEYIGNPIPTNSLYLPAELQDSYLTLRSYNTSRYEGSKLTSLLYNTYTSASYIGPDGFTTQTGDNSFGLSAVIDRNSTKVGWVKNFQSSSLNFYDKTSITLKYLVDENQNLIELNQRNANLFEVQNIFKSGDRTIVSLSDIVKPSFQKQLDGTKTIFKGGFSYDPILFRENNEPLVFLLEGLSVTNQFAGYKGIDKNSINIYNPNFVNSENNDIWSARRTYGIDILATTNGRVNVTIINPTSTTVNGNPIASLITGNWANTLSILGVTDNPSIEINWGRIGFVPRIQSIFNADPSYVSTDNTGTFWSSISGSRICSTTSTVNLRSILPSRHKYYSLDDLSVNSQIYSVNLKSLNGTMFLFTSSIDGGYYTDTENVISNDPNSPDLIVFKAPRDSDYRVSMKFPILIEMNSHDDARIRDYIYPCGFGASVEIESGPPYNKLGASFKFFFLLEKKEANTSNWKYVANTQITDTWKMSGNWALDNQRNVIHYRAGQGTEWWDWRTYTYSKVGFNLEFINISGNPYIDVPNIKAGTELRLRLIIMDLDRTFWYGKAFGMIIGRRTNWANDPNNENNIQRYTADYDPYFEIKDTITQITDFNQTEEYTADVFTARDNILTFDEDFNKYFLTQTKFAPSSSTEQLYTPVIDYVSIQPQDLIRLSSFKSPLPEYFTVITSSISFGTGIQQGNELTLGSLVNNNGITNYFGAIFDPSYIWTDGNITETKKTIIIPIKYNPTAFDFFSRIADLSDKRFKIKDVNIRNSTTTTSWYTSTAPLDRMDPFLEDKTFTIVGEDYVKIVNYEYKVIIQNNPTFVVPLPIRCVIVAVDEDIPNTSFNTYTSPTLGSCYPNNSFDYSPDTWVGGVHCTFQALNTLFNAKMNVVLDRNVPLSLPNINQNFAILRPKPDETSVIINHKKLDGNVSQTILIPSDASTSLKNKVGDIFKTLNTDLTNTNDQTNNNP